MKNYLKFCITFSTILDGVDYSLTKLKDIHHRGCEKQKKLYYLILGGINHGSKSSD